MRAGAALDSTAPCPCGSGITAGDCCAPFIEGRALPLTAEALMRSRYCAFTLRDRRYLLETWHPRTRPARLHFSIAQRWLGLRIRSRQGGGPGDAHGTVGFVARYKIVGRGGRHEELSRFERVDGAWRYVAGDMADGVAGSGADQVADTAGTAGKADD